MMDETTINEIDETENIEVPQAASEVALDDSAELVDVIY
jgi:hypothetical protein